MGAVHCSHQEQPTWPKEGFGKVSSPGAQSISEDIARALLIIHLLQAWKGNLRHGGT